MEIETTKQSFASALNDLIALYADVDSAEIAEALRKAADEIDPAG